MLRLLRKLWVTAVNMVMKYMYYSSNTSLSQSSIDKVDRGYATDRYDLELNAKPWSELFEHSGPSLESSISPLDGETITRSLDQEANTNDSYDRKDNDSSKPEAEFSVLVETTTFYKAALRYIKDIFLLIQHS